MTGVDGQVLSLHPMSSGAVGDLLLRVGPGHGRGYGNGWYGDGFGRHRGAEVADVVIDGFVNGKLVGVSGSEWG